MSKSNNLSDFLTDLANAIRAKKGTTEKIDPQGFSSEIEGLQIASKLQSKSVTPQKDSQNVTPDIGYDGLSSVFVSGEPNLTSNNVRAGVAIFGVYGSYSGGGTNTLTYVRPFNDIY